MLMMQALILSGRATCDRARVGCVLAFNGRVLAAGYNGSTPSAEHCDDVGHLMVNGHCVRTVHAEANAISNSARHGVSVAGATAYCTHRPCEVCIKQLLCAGIKRIVFLNNYDSDGGVNLFYEKMLASAGATMAQINLEESDIAFLESLVEKWRGS